MKIRSVARRLFQIVNRKFSVRENVVIGKNVHIGVGTVLWAPPGKALIIEDDVYFGKYCTVEVAGRIGRYSMIANNVGLVGRRDHDFRAVGRPIRFAPWIGDERSALEWPGSDVVIEEDVWLGYGAIVLTGVRVGRGSIIAAGAVVSQDIAAYDIVAGVPARAIGRRFDNEDIKKHETQIGYGRNQ